MHGHYGSLSEIELQGVEKVSLCNMQYHNGFNVFFKILLNLHPGWTLVFKVVSGITGRPATIWDMSISTYEFSLAALNTNNSFKHHYKNRIVQNWSEFKPVEVCA